MQTFWDSRDFITPTKVEGQITEQLPIFENAQAVVDKDGLIFSSPVSTELPESASPPVSTHPTNVLPQVGTLGGAPSDQQLRQPQFQQPPIDLSFMLTPPQVSPPGVAGNMLTPQVTPMQKFTDPEILRQKLKQQERLLQMQRCQLEEQQQKLMQMIAAQNQGVDMMPPTLPSLNNSNQSIMDFATNLLTGSGSSQSNVGVGMNGVHGDRLNNANNGNNNAVDQLNLTSSIDNASQQLDWLKLLSPPQQQLPQPTYSGTLTSSMDTNAANNANFRLGNDAYFNNNNNSDTSSNFGTSTTIVPTVVNSELNTSGADNALSYGGHFYGSGRYEMPACYEESRTTTKESCPPSCVPPLPSVLPPQEPEKYGFQSKWNNWDNQYQTQNTNVANTYNPQQNGQQQQQYNNTQQHSVEYSNAQQYYNGQQQCNSQHPSDYGNTQQQVQHQYNGQQVQYGVQQGNLNNDHQHADQGKYQQNKRAFNDDQKDLNHSTAAHTAITGAPSDMKGYNGSDLGHNSYMSGSQNGQQSNYSFNGKSSFNGSSDLGQSLAPTETIRANGYKAYEVEHIKGSNYTPRQEWAWAAVKEQLLYGKLEVETIKKLVQNLMHKMDKHSQIICSDTFYKVLEVLRYTQWAERNVGSNNSNATPLVNGKNGNKKSSSVWSAPVHLTLLVRCFESFVYSIGGSHKVAAYEKADQNLGGSQNLDVSRGESSIGVSIEESKDGPQTPQQSRSFIRDIYDVYRAMQIKNSHATAAMLKAFGLVGKLKQCAHFLDNYRQLQKSTKNQNYSFLVYQAALDVGQKMGFEPLEKKVRTYIHWDNIDGCDEYWNRRQKINPTKPPWKTHKHLNWAKDEDDQLRDKHEFLF